MAEASNLLGYKEYTQQDLTILRAIKLPTNNAEYPLYPILLIIEKLTGVGRDNIIINSAIKESKELIDSLPNGLSKGTVFDRQKK